MKLQLTGGAILCAALALSASKASAAASPDLLLCFRQVGSQAADLAGNAYDDDLIFDLGSLSVVNNPATTFNIGPDLAAVYGSNWATDSSLNWTMLSESARNNGLPSDTLFVSTPAGTAGSDAGTGTAQTPAQGYIGGLYGGYNAGTAGILSNAKLVDPTVTNSYSSEESNLASGVLDNWVENTGPGSATLWELYPGSGTAAQTKDIGTGTLDSSGNFSVVPEPSTWASMVIGAAGLLAFRRRRNS